VLGPDGKKYPTWHPPEPTLRGRIRPARFGHDHGADPGSSTLWSTCRRHFAFDANNDGSIDTSELALSGIPFGLVSEKLVNSSTPRLEDHTGYKIVLANGVARTLVAAVRSDVRSALQPFRGL